MRSSREKNNKTKNRAKKIFDTLNETQEQRKEFSLGETHQKKQNLPLREKKKERLYCALKRERV